MKKNPIYLKYDDIQRMINSLDKQMTEDDFIPNIVVGISRGGLVPAVTLSHRFGAPLYTIQWCSEMKNNETASVFFSRYR
jgi:hypoxanthine phosphoribosyltransferase